MATVEMPAIRRPTYMQRPKSNEPGFKPKPTARMQPKGASKPDEPFDPAELSRRLENHRQDLKLARARRELAEQKSQNKTPLPRNDSGNTIAEDGAEPKKEDEEERPTTSSSSKRPAADRRHSSARPRQGPRRKSVSAVRVKPRTSYIDPSLPYVPRTAARQFASTTTPIRKEGKDSRRLSAIEAGSHQLDWTSSPSDLAKSSPNGLDTTLLDRRRSAANALLQQANTAPPRQLTSHLAGLSLDTHHNDSDAENPYMLSSRSTHATHAHLDDASDAADGAARPSIKMNAKHDWSQASQYGDSARHSLHLFSGRKDRAGEYAEVADLQRPQAAHGGHVRNKPRQKSHGDMPENMIGEAVDRIKGERRRSSILGLFRRH